MEEIQTPYFFVGLNQYTSFMVVQSMWLYQSFLNMVGSQHPYSNSFGEDLHLTWCWYCTMRPPESNQETHRLELFPHNIFRPSTLTSTYSVTKEVPLVRIFTLHVSLSISERCTGLSRTPFLFWTVNDTNKDRFIMRLHFPPQRNNSVWLELHQCF